MKRSPYLWRGLLDLLVLLPVLFQFCTLMVAMLAGAMGSAILGYSLLTLVGGGFLIFCFMTGRWLIMRAARKHEDLCDQTKHLFLRYQPIALACSYTLLAALIGLFLPTPDDRAIFGSFVSVYGIAHFTSTAIVSLFYIFGSPTPWPYLAIPLIIYATYTAGMTWAFRELKTPHISRSAWMAAIGIFLVVLSLIFWRVQIIRGSVLGTAYEPPFAEKVVLEKYLPFTRSNLLVNVENPGLAIANNYPRLDGATAAYPIYAAAAQAIYTDAAESKIHELVESSTTPAAYRRLIAGEVDIIFAAQPSPQQRAEAEAAGVTLQLTPIGKEAFVFFVHKNNPVNGLTSQQIRQIYTKTIRNWSEVGGSDNNILPFQRPAGSGSQTALEQKVMGGEKLPAPLREEYSRGMGGIMQRVASYRNSREAIGYSFRFFATTMNALPDIKLLEIDGIAPTRENIRAGIYPYTVDLYAITGRTKNPHAKEFVDWFLTPAGQKLIDDTGYVSLNP